MKTKKITNQAPIHLFGLLILLLSLSACGGSGSDSTEQPNSPNPVQPEPQPKGPEAGSVLALDDLTAGTCIDAIESVNGAEFMRVMACDQAHQYEMAGTYELTEFTGQYPGRIAIERVIHQGCRTVFENHTGQPYTGRDFAIQTIAPSRSTWDNGDRTVLCLLMNIDRSMLTRSLSK